MHTLEARNFALRKHAKGCLVYDQPLSFTSQLSANEGRMQAGENVRQFSLCHFFACFLLLFVLDGVGWRLLTLESTPDGEGGGGHQCK